MNITNIYQTLEDRGNYPEIESHGPYFCSLRDDCGRLKKGIKEPWLGEGYYFWDTRIDDARWWGEKIYERHMKGYIVCHTCYDQHSPLLYDMVGSISMFDDFIECAKIIKSEKKEKKIAFPVVLEYLRQREGFDYKAIRVWPDPIKHITNPHAEVFFPWQQATIKKLGKIQICFFDKTLLTQPFTIEEKHPVSSDFTI